MLTRAWIVEQFQRFLNYIATLFVRTYVTMPLKTVNGEKELDTDKLMSYPYNKPFRTLGFYAKHDGCGGLYILTTDNWGYGLNIGKNAQNVSVWLVALDDRGILKYQVDVTRYGVRSYKYNTLDFANLSVKTTFAEKNSQIINSFAISNATTGMASMDYKSVLYFPDGKFFFAEPIDLTGKHMGIKGARTPQVIALDMVEGGGIAGGTMLYFPWLEDGQSAITVNFGNVENISIIGNKLTYDFLIARPRWKNGAWQDDGYTREVPYLPVINETINASCTGLKKLSHGYVRNVNVVYFNKGIDCTGANTYIDNIFATHCHSGLEVGSDIKCRGVYGFNVYLLLKINNSLVSAVQVRGDSVVYCVVITGGRNITLVDVDGDYCTENVINIRGTGCQRAVIMNVHGRCCANKVYDHDENPDGSPTIQSLLEADPTNNNATKGYGLIRVENNAQFVDSYVIMSRIDSAPIDGLAKYYSPRIAFTFGKVRTSAQQIRNNHFVFIANENYMTNSEDLKKYFQTQNDVQMRIDTAKDTCYIEGSNLYSINDKMSDMATGVDNFKALVLASTDFADLQARLGGNS